MAKFEFKDISIPEHLFEQYDNLCALDPDSKLMEHPSWFALVDHGPIVGHCCGPDLVELGIEFARVNEAETLFRYVDDHNTYYFAGLTEETVLFKFQEWLQNVDDSIASYYNNHPEEHPDYS